MRYLMLAAAVFAAAGSVAAGELTIAARGKASDYVVVIGDSPAENVAYAASEFAAWTEKLTGVRLRVASKVESAVSGARHVVLIGVDETLGEDDFSLKSTPGGEVCVKGGRRGVLYGVYELIERFGGILWLAPDFTEVPVLAAFKVPDDLAETQRPAIAGRSLDTFNCWGRQDFAARMRLNRCTPNERMGGWYGAFDRELGNCHTFLKLVPPDKYYKDHPEYFSLVKGKRLKEHAQLCLTNPDVFKIVLAKVLERIAANKADAHPHRRATRFYGISQDDWNNYCECPNCAAIDAREESHAGCVIDFLNRLGEEVEKQHPDVMLQTLAYMYSRKPPKHLKPRHNVAISLCTIECDFSKPMVVNRYKENLDFKENVLKWRDIAKELQLWDYAANWRATPTPYPNLSAMAANIRFYRDAGAQHLFEEGIANPAASFTDLKGWLGAKLMWRPDQPLAPLMEKFCAAYYGKAAPYVLESIRLMEAQPIDETKTPITYAVPVEKMPYSAEFYEKSAELWRQAEAAVAHGDPRVARNVAWGRFGVEYSRAALYAQSAKWKPVIASRTLAAKLDRAEFEQMRELARWCEAMLASRKDAMVSSRLNDARMKGYIHALAVSEPPPPAAEGEMKAVMQDWALSYCDHPKSTTMSRVDDPEATDGRALDVRGEEGDWKITCRPNETVAFDTGSVYRVRARIKVKPAPNAKPKVGLLALGVFDRVTRKNPLAKPIFPAEATGKYEWYELGSFTASDHELILFVDPRGAHFAIDCLEFTTR